MPAKLTSGKVAGLNAVSNQRGVIAAIALDQRGLLKKMLAREMNGAPPSDKTVTEFKELVVSSLAPFASAILLDVEYGLPVMRHAGSKGILLAYEKSCYDETAPEFLPRLTEGWSALRLKNAGAAAVKILLFYSPFEKAEVNEQKKAWVERIGAECRAIDIPMFLELLSYFPDLDSQGGSEALERAKRKPEVVISSIEEFSKEQYGVDVLKLEPPVDMKYVPGTLDFRTVAAYTRDEARQYFQKAAAATEKPFVYLSAGVTNAAFVETLQFALDSGVEFQGVLGGRAIWQGAVPVFARQGAAACREWLAGEGARNVQAVTRVLESAASWRKPQLVTETTA